MSGNVEDVEPPGLMKKYGKAVGLVLLVGVLIGLSIWAYKSSKDKGDSGTTADGTTASGTTDGGTSGGGTTGGGTSGGETTGGGTTGGTTGGGTDDPCSSAWPATSGGRLVAPFTITGNGTSVLRSKNEIYSLIFQPDGNAQVRNSSAVVWETGSVLRKPADFVMETLGNFFVADSSGTVMWIYKSDSSCPASLVLPDNGELQIVDKAGTVLWKATLKQN